MDACGVDEGHLTHTDDAHLRPSVPQCSHDFLKLVACAEEVGAIDFVDFHAIGDGEMLEIA